MAATMTAIITLADWSVSGDEETDPRNVTKTVTEF